MVNLRESVLTRADGKEVRFGDLLENDKNPKNGISIVVFLRHFGWLFCWEFAKELNEELIPLLESKGSDLSNVKFSAIGIGSGDAASVFAEKVGNFPTKYLYADLEGETYKEIGFYSNFGRLFFAKATGEALKNNQAKQDRMKELMKVYDFSLVPENKSLTLNQGGALIVKGGEEILYSHFDKGTGAHMSIDKMIEVVKENSTTIKTANSGTTLFSRFFSS